MSEVVPVRTTDPGVAAMVQALTAELAESGYSEEESFGYSLAQLDAGSVRLVGAYSGSDLVGIGGIEIDDRGSAELKRFYVSPDHRGSGVAAALLATLLDVARTRRVGVVRLETGDQQHAAMAFYRRHGFEEIPRFGPYVDSATSVCFELILPSA